MSDDSSDPDQDEVSIENEWPDKLMHGSTDIELMCKKGHRRLGRWFRNHSLLTYGFNSDI